NDCDGEIDEGADFYCGIGECRRKSELCGVLCTPGQPTEESCNGLDDDCDGETDEGFCPGGQVCQEGTCIGLDELPPQSGDELEAAERESSPPEFATDAPLTDGTASVQPDTTSDNSASAPSRIDTASGLDAGDVPPDPNNDAD